MSHAIDFDIYKIQEGILLKYLGILFYDGLQGLRERTVGDRSQRPLLGQTVLCCSLWAPLRKPEQDLGLVIVDGD